MLNTFMAEIEAAAEQLKKRLIQHAHREFVEEYAKNTALTPSQSNELAAEFVKRFLSEELYYRMIKPNLTPKNHDKSPD